MIKIRTVSFRITLAILVLLTVLTSIPANTVEDASVSQEMHGKTYGPLFAIRGFIFLDNNLSANIGIDVVITNMETMESLTTQTEEMNDLARYAVEIKNGLPSGVEDGDQIRVSAVDSSYSSGSYRGEAYGIADTDTALMTVNVTLSFDSNPWVMGFSLTSQEIFEGESIDFQVQALDDNGVEKVTLEINGEENIQMSLTAGNSTDGTWICSNQFDNKGTYTVKAISEDSINQTSSPTQEIIITVNEDYPPDVVLSANVTVIPLSGIVNFTANITEDRYLNNNVTIYISGAENGNNKMILEEVSGDNQIWMLKMQFNLTGINYCHVIAWDDFHSSVSNTIAISVGVSDSAPAIGSLSSNVSIIIQDESVNFTITGSDDNGIDNIYLFSTDSSYNVSMSLIEGTASDGSWSAVIIFDSPGHWSFKAHAIDTSGNDSGNSTSVSITVIKADTEPEIVDIVTSLDTGFPAVIATGTEVSYQVSAVDDKGVVRAHLLVNDLPVMMELISGNMTEGVWEVKRTFDLPGLHTSKIILIDTADQVVNSSEFTIEVDAPPIILMLHASRPVLPVGIPVTFNVTAYDDRQIDRVEIEINGTSLNMSSSHDSWEIMLGFTSAGMYRCIARAFDNLSQFSESITWVKVIPDNSPTLTVLRSSQIFIEEGNFVDFTIEVSDDYNVSSVMINIEFEPYEMVLVSGNATSNQWSFSHKFIDAGEYTCTVIALDSLGQESDISNAIIIFVSPSTGSETSITSTTKTSPGLLSSLSIIAFFTMIILRKKR